MRFVAAVLMVAVGACLLYADADSDIQALILNRVDTARKAVGIFAGTVDAEGTLFYGAGYTSRESGRKPDGDTIFEIGSISKVFTSLLLADMMERGEVKGDDPVSKYLPGNAPTPGRNGKQITLLDLSMQVSGLPRLPDNMKPADPANPYADYDGPKLLAFLKGYQLPRDPGEKYEYSNLGVGLLGFALANRAGTTYEKLVEQRIFKPLKMDSSTVTVSAEQKTRLARGYDADLRPVKNWDLDALAGAGAIRSTPNDMLHFLAAHLGFVHTKLDGAIERMRSVRRDTGMPHIQIAMAWHISNDYGADIYWHNGGTAGYRSFIGMDLAAKRGVVVLCNTAFDIDNIGFHHLNSQYPAPLLVARHEIKLDPKALSDYEGKYQLAPEFAVTVTAENGHLYTRATGQQPVEMFASDKDQFFLKVVDAQIDFVRDASGKVSRIVVHQGGRDTPGERVAADVPHAIAIDAKLLASYVGEYRIAPDVTITVTARDGRLFALATDQQDAEIFASKPDEFFYKVVDARITFTRDASGKVTGLTLHQNGKDIPGPRVR